MVAMRDHIISDERQKVQDLWEVVGQLATESQIHATAEKLGISMQGPEVNGVGYLEHGASSAAIPATAAAANSSVEDAAAHGQASGRHPTRKDSHWAGQADSRRATREPTSGHGGTSTAMESGPRRSVFPVQSARQSSGVDHNAASQRVSKTGHGTSQHAGYAHDSVSTALQPHAPQHASKRLEHRAHDAPLATSAGAASQPPTRLLPSQREHEPVQQAATLPSQREHEPVKQAATLPSAFEAPNVSGVAGASHVPPALLARLSHRASARPGRDRSATLGALHAHSESAANVSGPNARQARQIGRSARTRGPLSSLPEGEARCFSKEDSGMQALRATCAAKRAGHENVVREHSMPALLEVRIFACTLCKLCTDCYQLYGNWASPVLACHVPLVQVCGSARAGVRRQRGQTRRNS